MDVQQQLFTTMLTALRERGLKVYDGPLPSLDTPYPFVYMDEMDGTYELYKGALFADVTLTFHVWHDDPQQRGTVSELMKEIKETCLSYGNVTGMNQQMLADDTTGRTLVHGIVSVTWQAPERMD